MDVNRAAAEALAKSISFVAKMFYHTFVEIGRAVEAQETRAKVERAQTIDRQRSLPAATGRPAPTPGAVSTKPAEPGQEMVAAAEKSTAQIAPEALAGDAPPVMVIEPPAEPAGDAPAMSDSEPAESVEEAAAMPATLDEAAAVAGAEDEPPSAPVDSGSLAAAPPVDSEPSAAEQPADLPAAGQPVAVNGMVDPDGLTEAAPPLEEEAAQPPPVPRVQRRTRKPKPEPAAGAASELPATERPAEVPTAGQPVGINGTAAPDGLTEAARPLEEEAAAPPPVPRVQHRTRKPKPEPAAAGDAADIEKQREFSFKRAIVTVLSIGKIPGLTNAEIAQKLRIRSLVVDRLLEALVRENTVLFNSETKLYSVPAPSPKKRTR